MGEYIYRTQQGYENGMDFKCKNPNDLRSVDYHIGHASDKLKNGKIPETRFISTTGKISIAKYKYSQGENRRNPIALIDLKKLKELKDDGQIYDFRDDEVLKVLSKRSQNLVKADREVTIEYDIPAECCKKIPPLIVDVLSALDLQNTEKEEMRILINAINDMVMNDEIGEIEEIISKIPFNKLEKNFMDKYYADKMPTLEEVGAEIFPNVEGNDIVSQCIQREILKKIFGCKEFTKLLESKIPDVSLESPDYKNIKVLKRILASGNPELLLGQELRPKEEIKAQAQGTKRKADGYYISPYLWMKFEEMQRTEKPKDIAYVYNERGEVIGVVATYDCIVKDRNEPPKVAYSMEISIDIAEINIPLDKEKNQNDNGITPPPINIDVKEIGEKSLTELDANSVINANKREKTEMDRENTELKENDSRQ